MRRALLLAALLALALPAAAGAHATLEGTVPAQGATVKTQPAMVVFRFDENVEGNFGAVRVFDSAGKRADQGDAFHPGGRGDEMAVHLKPRLPFGTYTATYRVVSADSHIVSSGFVFSIGRQGAAPGKSVAQLTAGSKLSTTDKVAFDAVRALQYGAIAVAAGALVFLLVVWLPALGALGGDGSAFARRWRTVVLVACAVGVVSAAAGIVLEAAEAAGISFWSALKVHIVREELSTRFGTIWGIAVLVWIAVAVLAAVPRRRVLTWALAVPLGFLVLLPALSGHGSTQSPTGVMFPANAIHVAAISSWLGGLVLLLAAVPAATRSLAPTNRTRLLAAVLVRFSPLALGAVIVILTTGLVQSYVEIRHLNLIFTTSFGIAAFIKLCVLIGLIGLGALNRQRTVPRLRALAAEGATPGTAGVTLRNTLRAEVLTIVAVLGVAGALAGYAPAIAQYTGPFSTTTRIGPKLLQIDLDPARVGLNTVHLYITDPKTGQQFAGAKEIDLAEVLPSKGIGPLNQKGTISGPGHFTVTGVLLNVPGTWRVTVTLRVSAFDEFTKTLKVRVR